MGTMRLVIDVPAHMRHHTRMRRTFTFTSSVIALAVCGCASGPIIGSGGTPASQIRSNDRDIDLVNDPMLEYRTSPNGFPIPEDAVSQGQATFLVPRGYHQTARMQRTKLEELGFTIESSRPAANAYRFHAKKGEKNFLATITSPRGANDSESSVLEIVEE
jgi:hypothetical protein